MTILQLSSEADRLATPQAGGIDETDPQEVFMPGLALIAQRADFAIQSVAMQTAVQIGVLGIEENRPTPQAGGIDETEPWEILHLPLPRTGQALNATATAIAVLSAVQTTDFGTEENRPTPQAGGIAEEEAWNAPVFKVQVTSPILNVMQAFLLNPDPAEFVLQPALDDDVFAIRWPVISTFLTILALPNEREETAFPLELDDEVLLAQAPKLGLSPTILQLVLASDEMAAGAGEDGDCFMILVPGIEPPSVLSAFIYDDGTGPGIPKYPGEDEALLPMRFINPPSPIQLFWLGSAEEQEPGGGIFEEDGLRAFLCMPDPLVALRLVMQWGDDFVGLAVALLIRAMHPYITTTPMHPTDTRETPMSTVDRRITPFGPSE